MQQALKPASRAARAKVVAAELFGQLDVAVDDAHAAWACSLDVGFGREGIPPLTRDAESWGGCRDRDACAWHPPWLDARPDRPRRLASMRGCALESLQLALPVRLALLLLLLLLLGVMTAVEAAGRGAQHAVMAGVVTGDTADDGALEAALGVGGG